MAELTERGVENWFFTGVQKHEKTHFLAKLRKEFPDKTEEDVEEALVNSCREVKISEGRETLEASVRAKLG